MPKDKQLRNERTRRPPRTGLRSTPGSSVPDSGHKPMYELDSRLDRGYLRIVGDGVPVYTCVQRGFVASLGQVRPW